MIQASNNPPKWQLNTAGLGYCYVSAPRRRQLTTQRCLGAATEHDALMEANVMGELQLWKFEDARVRWPEVSMLSV